MIQSVTYALILDVMHRVCVHNRAHSCTHCAPDMQIFTWAGMSVLAGLGFFTPKKLPAARVIPIALGFVGYVVLCNVSLQINTVGFYQVRTSCGKTGHGTGSRCCC